MMKFKLLFGFMLVGLCYFSIQSCTNSFEEDGAEISYLEGDTDDSDYAPVVTYCRYNVTYSEAAHIPVGSIICTTCITPCAKEISKKVPVGNNKVTVKGTRVSKSCKQCPADGHII